jgi:hypothetical protein
MLSTRVLEKLQFVLYPISNQSPIKQQMPVCSVQCVRLPDCALRFALLVVAFDSIFSFFDARSI